MTVLSLHRRLLRNRQFTFIDSTANSEPALHNKKMTTWKYNLHFMLCKRSITVGGKGLGMRLCKPTVYTVSFVHCELCIIIKLSMECLPSLTTNYCLICCVLTDWTPVSFEYTASLSLALSLVLLEPEDQRSPCLTSVDMITILWQ